MLRVQEPSKIQKISVNIFRGLSLVLVPIAAIVPSVKMIRQTLIKINLIKKLSIPNPHLCIFF